jgi:hypothetical protein
MTEQTNSTETLKSQLKEITTAEKSYVYQMNALRRTQTGQLKCIGYIDIDQKFRDEPMEYTCVKPNLIVNGNNININLYKCNINHGYMLNNKKLPVMYASLTYNKPLVTGHLFNMYIMFEITTDTTAIKTVNELLARTLEGKYTIQIDLDDKIETINLTEFLGYNDTADNFMKILSSEGMINIMKLQLKKRDEERIKKWGSPSEYKITVPKYNFNDLVKKYENGEDIQDVIKNT